MRKKTLNKFFPVYWRRLFKGAEKEHSAHEKIQQMQDMIDAGFKSGVSTKSMDDVLKEARQHINAPAEPTIDDLLPWQRERILAGIRDAEAGRVRPADEVFAEIAKEHGWEK